MPLCGLADLVHPFLGELIHLAGKPLLTDLGLALLLLLDALRAGSLDH